MELFNTLQSSCEAGFDQPLIDFLEKKKNGKNPPPYTPRCSIQPLYKLAQLALLWNEAGFVKEARELAGWLIPLKDYPSLWCSEKEYNPAECKEWFSRLAALEPLPGWSPDFSYSLFEHGVFTFSGKGTTLGVIRSKDAEIRAFGPQSPKLIFGIDGKGSEGWISTFAYPEVWFHIKPEVTEENVRLSLRFMGVTQETPLFFSFYVKAPLCKVGGEIFKPKSLKRFIGDAARVELGSMAIESSQVHKVEVIPLAGEGGFWDADFLVSFEIHPLLSSFFLSCKIV
jgi:hypothetical protein